MLQKYHQHLQTLDVALIIPESYYSCQNITMIATLFCLLNSICIRSEANQAAQKGIFGNMKC